MESGKWRRWLVAWMALSMWAGPLGAATVTVFAAASLTEALEEIGAAYEKQTGDHVRFNFGGSSTLARQIEAGAPADLFFSADEAKMDGLAGQGKIVPETRRSRLSNSLVIVVAAQGGAEVRAPEDLAAPRIGRIALGDPRAVPAGIYARQYLEGRKLWAGIEPKVVETEDVRAALAAVAAGTADAALVYKTDAALSKRVRTAFEVPRAEGPRISYPVALLKEAPAPEAARRFLEHLFSAEAARVFERYGFVCP